MSEFITTRRPMTTNWQLFALSLQEAQDVILEHNYNVPADKAESIRRLLLSNIEVLFGARN